MIKKVLIIEDDNDTLELLLHIVSHLNFECSDSKFTLPLDELDRIKPDLILLDHWLPNEYGADYCNKIKSNDATRRIPVIIISFVAKLAEIALNSKADAHIAKPFEVDELEDLIRKMIK